MERFNQGEVGHGINDPMYAVELAVGPPSATLVPQTQGTGLVIGGHYAQGPAQFVLKKAHMSRDDLRIFSVHSKRVVAVLSHYGKNPYNSIDPLGLSHAAQWSSNYNGEWESLSSIAGMSDGMPTLRVRPKAMSMHGRQLVQSIDGRTTYFNIGKLSKIKEMSVRSNLSVSRGEDPHDVLYRIHPDLMGRTVEIINEKGEQICFMQKSTKALILNAALGAGSEMYIEVAPGVDWTAMLAICLAINQVGEHWIKDAAGNFVFNPLQNEVQDQVLQATGLQGVANSLGHQMDSGMRFMNRARDMYNMFK